MKKTIKTLKELLSMYRFDRFDARGEKYKEAVINSHLESLKNNGNTLISPHDNVTGQAIWLFR